MQDQHSTRLPRRAFFGWASRRGAGLGLAAVSLPAFVQACVAGDDPTIGGPASPDTDAEQARAIVGDVIDFKLTSPDWEGNFGSVTFKLHKGVFDGQDLYYIRTDVSDQSYATREGLVYVPKMSSLVAAGATADAYLVIGGTADQATVVSTAPGRPDYTPAWRLHEVSWKGTPRSLTSIADIEAARTAGDIEVVSSETVLNGMAVKWSGGEMAVDDERTVYLGPGQLLASPDTSAMTVTFKLHECFPGVRYIVVDTSMKGMADGMNVVHSPRLEAATAANATGRTNVLMNGLEGPGPMGFQPSVFDSQAGTPAWSPYWDHMTYGWKDGATPRLLRTEAEIHAARDAGDLDEFVGSPMTDGTPFVVNCPVPVLAPNTFAG